jgi:hypothetical protein
MVLGSGIQDPGSGKNLFRIQGSKRHQIPDPGSGSATLNFPNYFLTIIVIKGTVA